MSQKHITVVITGASGSQLGLELIKLLQHHQISVSSVLTLQGATNLLLECGTTIDEIKQLSLEQQWLKAKEILGKIDTFHPNDFFAPIASGSNPPDALVIIPASMGYCGRIAHGLGSTLAERVFDVCLKEQKPIFIAPRETPLNTIQLRSLTILSELGAQIIPFMPEFYSGQNSMQAQIKQFLNRLLVKLGIDNNHYKWGEINPDLNNCFVCGVNNKVGLQLNFTIDYSSLRSHAAFKIATEYQSYNGLVHGGILSTILDEAMGKIGSMSGYQIVTHDLQIKLLKPLKVMQEATVTGELTHKKWKIAHGNAQIKANDGQIIATAQGRFKIIGSLPFGIG